MRSVLWSITVQALLTPRRTAVVDDRGSYTYGQLLGGAMTLAEKIDASTSASQVGVMLPTSGAFPVALLGVWLAGRVAVPLNYLLAADELSYVIGDSDIDTIVTSEVMLDVLRGDEAGEGQGKRPASIPDDIRLLNLEKVDFSGFPPVRWPPMKGRDDLAVILYTSGTSGRPKGVMLTHGNLASDIEASIEHAGLTSADVFLGVLPQFHSFGLTGLTLLPLRIGSKVVYSARFVPRKVVGLIRDHRPGLIMALPSMYGALLSVKSATPEDFSSVRLAVSGGEPLPAAVNDRCVERFGLRLLEGYGLTETAPITHWATPDQNKPKSVGRALPGITVVVVDDRGRVLPAGEEGEVLIAGPNVMKGYFKLPKQTAGVFVKGNALDWSGVDGAGGQVAGGSLRFFRTGDMGRVDGEGYLFITGRIKEMLIVGGENVFPREIEEVLNRHASVAASAVIGQADDLRGEVPVAFVEWDTGNGGFDESAIRAWCRESLAGYKVPRKVYQVEALPRTATGKILRRGLEVPEGVA